MLIALFFFYIFCVVSRSETKFLLILIKKLVHHISFLYVIYLETKEDAKPSSYEQVKEKIIATLKQQQFAAKVTEVAKELKSKAKIVDMTAKENSQK